MTWPSLSDIPVRPGDKVEESHELHEVQAADGRILVHIRNHNAANDRQTLQCESQDGGKTWSTPHEIGVWGMPSHLLRLRDGRLLLSYEHRPAPLRHHTLPHPPHRTTAPPSHQHPPHHPPPHP